MSREQIRICRDELYEKVWSTPMIHLAKEYGLSDNGLRKICKKLKVPMPPAGYWTRIKYGKKVTQAPLKPLDPGAPDSHIIEHARSGEGLVLSDDAEEAVSHILKQENKITVPEKVRYHPLVREAKQALQKQRPDERGMLSIRRNYLNLSVSRDSIKRALRILNSLTKAVESKGFAVRSTQDNGVCIHALGEKVPFCLREKTKQIEHIPTKQEIQNHKLYPTLYPIPEWDRAPNGMLYLRIDSYASDVPRKTWSDGKKQRLELMLNDFIAGAIRFADVERKHRKEREEWHRKWEEERKERERQNRMIKMIEEQSELWFKSQKIREWIGAVEKALEKRNVQEEAPEGVDEYLFFAKRYADYLDPTKGDLNFVVDS